MADNVVRIRSYLDDKVSGQLAKMKDQFDLLGKSKGFQSIVTGVGVGIGVGIWQNAAGRIVDVLGDMTEAAIADEESQNRLRASLAANVVGFDGNTDAIERNIKAKQRLGFDDETLRDSLTVLAGATHNVAEAERVQAIAMDLARFKGIDLRTASEALIKVEGGHYRALATLGIKLREGATATEALAAVEKIAAGQAEAFANTTRGKLVASQIAVGEAMESLGTVGLPLVVTGMEAAADAATTLAGTYEFLSGKTKLTNDEQIDLGVSLLDMASSFPMFGRMFGVMADQYRAGLEDVAVKSDHSMDAAEHLRGAWAGSLGEMEDAAEDWSDTWSDTTGETIRRANKVRDVMADTAQDIIDDYFDPLEIAAELKDNHEETLAAAERARLAKGKKAHNDARDDIVQALDDQASTLVDLGKRGKLTGKQIDQFEADAKASYKALGLRVPAEIQKIIDRLRVLAGLESRGVNVSIKAGWKGHAPGKGPTEFDFDEGGRVPGPIGQAHTATVHGGEYVISNDMQRQMGVSASASSGVGPTYNITVNAGAGSGLTAGSARELANQLGPAIYADMQRRGLLARAGTGLRG